MRKYKNVESYISAAPKEAQGKLRKLRAVIKEVAPGASESISYGMPGYGKGQLCWFALMKTHVGLYLRPPIIEEHKDILAAYKTTKSAVHLPLGKEIPVTLVKKLLRARLVKNRQVKK